MNLNYSHSPETDNSFRLFHKIKYKVKIKINTVIELSGSWAGVAM